MKRLFFLFLIFIVSSCSSPVRKQRGTDDIALAEIISHRPKIVIDAGHGGKDTGTKSAGTPAYQEKILNLSTALYLESFLQKMGYQTVLTRGEDYFVPLDLRASFANSNHATLFVSIHYNSAPSTKAEGVEIYYYETEEDKKRATDSKILAQSVLDDIVTSTSCKSRGVKKGNFAVIRETKMPAILVEGGFLTNENERSKLLTPSYLKTIAGSIALGVDKYLKSAR